MTRIREILLTQYIGAILIGYVAAQGFIGIVSLATVPLRWYLQGRNPQTQSVLFNEQPHQIPFPWDSTLSGLTTVLLYFAIAYALLRWLYPPTAGPADPSEQDAEEELGDLRA